jgi:spore coat polysaccharide biosynthesis protein SpsF
MLKKFIDGNVRGEALDYMSNGLRRTFPRGLDAEIFSREALERTQLNARQPYEREHVTPYIYQHPESFRIHSFEGEKDLSHFRWTLDTEQDFEMLSRIFQGLKPGGAALSTAEVLAFLHLNPEVAAINAEIRQKALGE